jgi:hypothetical protein
MSAANSAGFIPIRRCTVKMTSHHRTVRDDTKRIGHDLARRQRQVVIGDAESIRRVEGNRHPADR